MATYSTLKSGSSGSEVKKLQQALVSAGYDVGSAGVDGIYGNATTAAVRKYQQDMGLSVDGIAGDQTLGSLYGAGTKKATTAPASTGTGTATPEYSKYQYDASTNDAYQQAMVALEQAKAAKPTYAGTYDQQLKDLYDQIVNREKFSYDVNADALYQQYKDQYVTQGKMAMMDTMGQAAALTGGYGNSYAQNVGQQAYQGYLQQLNEVVPELYGMALDQYNQEGDAMMEQYAMLGDLQDTEYGRYQDALDRYWQDVSYQQQLADDAYDQGYENWYNAYQMGIDAENTAYEREYQKEQDAYNRQQDSYEKLVSLITSTGYSPSAAELEAAGMSSAQAKSYANYYKENKKPTTTSSSSSKSSSGSPKKTSSSSSSSGSPKKTTTPTTTTTKTQKPYTYGYYVGWDAGDWEGYFAKIRQKEGKAAAQEELNYFTSHGLIPKSKVVYAASGVRGGQIGH